MSCKSSRIAALALFAGMAAQTFSLAASAASSAEERGLNELRSTVVNLLQALVDRGVVTREQAQAMVESAQKKAADEAAAAEAKEKDESNAVRVPYVPQIVKDEIRRQVAQDLAPEVTKDVVEQAQSEGWGVPAALPDWIKRVRLSGDMRVRGQGDLYASDNIDGSYLDLLAVNDAGGIANAGLGAFTNVTQDRSRLRARFRFGLESELGGGWQLGARMTTGNLRDPVSTNQTLGNTGARYQTGFDLAYLKWHGSSSTGRHALNVSAGRIQDPWLGTDLVWDQDLTFEGVAANYRLGLVRDNPYARYAFLTVGAFPIQEIELSTKDKWLYGGQLGIEWEFAGGSRMRMGVAYYQYDNITGKKNEFGSTLLDYTAPQFVQKGNTVFDIRNDNDEGTQLFALAADYHLAGATIGFDWKVSDLYRLSLTGDYVKNVGYDEAKIFERTGDLVPARDTGYQAELSFGSATMARSGAWRAYVGYRYVERDAVLDAFTDSDFHLGGTDAKGYFFGGDIAFTPRVFARLRYLTSDSIDGVPLGIDVVQLDLNASF